MDNHVPLKQEVFICSEIKGGIATIFNKEDDKDITHATRINTVNYDLLRPMEILIT